MLKKSSIVHSVLFVACFLAMAVQTAYAAEAKSATVYKSGNKPIVLSSWISEVTVFSDRALVTRRGSVNLAAGEHHIVFKRLPGDTDTNSIQVKGTGRATLKGVNTKPMHMSELADKDLLKLNRKKEGVEDAIQDVQDSINQAKSEKKFIEAIAKKLTTATEKTDQGELSPQKWIDMVQFYRRKLAKLDREVRDGNKKLPELKQELSKIKREISDLNRATNRKKYEVEAWVAVSENSKVTLELSYVVYGPRWYPKYDIRADSKNAKINLAYNAVIQQNSGENWSRVKLTLSTAQPKAGGQHPKLSPWRVRPVPVAPPAPRRSRYKSKKMAVPRAEPAMSAEMMDMEVGAAAAPEPQMDVVQAQVESQAASVVFSIKGKQTVRSDNQPHQVGIFTKGFPAKFAYSAVPKLVQFAYLKAQIKNETDYPLLTGATNLFLDNNFVASGNIETVAPGEEFWAFLGVDEGIKVEHKLINRLEQGDGMFGGRNKVTYEYEVIITNNKKQAHDVTIKDQFPLSGHKDISVELIEPKYRDGQDGLKKDQLNELEWAFQVAAKEEKKIKLKFSISYPKDMRVIGL